MHATRARLADGPSRGPLRSRRLAFTVIAAFLGLALFAGSTAGGAGPSSSTDESKVPHYFGPYPNWANSPLTLPDATVTITGSGSGATATASVGANGAITAITVTNGGSNYSNAKVDIAGPGSGAAASATIVKKGAIVGITLTANGAGYTAPTVTISGGGAGSGGTASAYGGVDAVTLTDGGAGYTAPTVDFDLPDLPGGTQARGLRDDGRERRDHGRRRRRPGLRLLDRAGRRDPQRDAVRPGHAGHGRQVRRREGDAGAERRRRRQSRRRLLEEPGHRHRRSDGLGRGRDGGARQRRHRLDQGEEARLGLRHAERDQEVPGRAAGPRPERRQQPRAVHPGRRARHVDVRERGLLRDRARAAPGADELEPAARARCCANTCSSRPASVPGKHVALANDLLDGAARRRAD